MPALLEVQGQTYPVDACLFDKDGTLIGFDHWLPVMRARVERIVEALSPSPEQISALLSVVGLAEGVHSGKTEPAVLLPRDEAEQALISWGRHVGGMSEDEARNMVRRTFIEVDNPFPLERYLRPAPGSGCWRPLGARYP
ncbi:MAG: hypothetical protein R6U88_01000 [Candidatus Bipolaricaulota bacterium]